MHVHGRVLFESEADEEKRARRSKRVASARASGDGLVGRAPRFMQALEALQRMAQSSRPLRITPQAVARLAGHDWPGNIRELRNVLERASLLPDDGVIDLPQLPALAAAAPPAPSGRRMPDADLAALARAFPGPRRALAAQLGLSERTLYRRLRRLGIAMPARETAP